MKKENQNSRNLILSPVNKTKKVNSLDLDFQ